VRIAFCGSHRVGKTTLLESVGERLQGYETVDEPYYLLEEDGHEVAEEPAVEDFVAQLERSVAELEVARRDVLFDRSPIDVLAYLLEHADAEAFDPDAWIEPAREAVASLDLVVFVPIEDPERIAVGRHEDAEQRRAVDERVRRLLIDEGLAGEVEVLTVGGDVPARTEQVLARISAQGSHR
jgi:hypothetical protein